LSRCCAFFISPRDMESVAHSEAAHNARQDIQGLLQEFSARFWALLLGLSHRAWRSKLLLPRAARALLNSENTKILLNCTQDRRNRVDGSTQPRFCLSVDSRNLVEGVPRLHSFVSSLWRDNLRILESTTCFSRPMASVALHECTR
jgi:hypothetical protein